MKTLVKQAALHCMENIARHGRDFSRTLPCGIVLAGILCALLPAMFLPDSFASILIPPAAVLPVLGILGAKRTAFQFILPCLIAMFSWNWHNMQLKADPVSVFAQGRPEVGAVAELTVIDTNLCGKRLGWMPNPPTVLCRLDHAGYSTGDRRHAVGGYVMMRVPKDSPLFSCGDRILAAGVLSAPDGPRIPGAFDYRQYLRIRGVQYLFLPFEPPQIIGYRNSFMRSLLHVRSVLLDRMLTPLEPESVRRLCAGMLFGCRQGIPAQTRQEFIRSGTIHILTVSGLHIGMFAGILFLLLGFLPLRVRCMIVPLLTAFYALGTGMQMPAIRALTMLCAWCFMRAFLLRSSALNSVFAACSLLLFWNPHQLADPGFQYSFTIVIFLVASLPVTSELGLLLSGTLRWIPSERIPRIIFWKMRLFRSAFTALAGCFIAWLASSGLTLLYQGISVPFSVEANILILPLAWLCFFTFCVGSLFGFLLPGTISFTASLLGILAGSVNGICCFFSGLGDIACPMPRLWSVPAFLVLLMILLRTTSKRTVLCTASLLGVIFFVWCGGLFPAREAEVLIVSGGGLRVPVIAVSIPEYRFSALVNAPDFVTVRDAVSYLKRRGHGSLNSLILTSCLRTETRGAKYLYPMMPVENTVMPRPVSRRASAAGEALSAAVRNGSAVCFAERTGGDEWRCFSQGVKTFLKKEESEIAFSRFDSKITVKIKQDNGFLRVTVRNGAGRIIGSVPVPAAREKTVSVITIQKAGGNRI